MNKKDVTPAQVVMTDVAQVKKNEKVLIIANPETNVIAQQLYTAARDSGAKPVLMYQCQKTGMDNAEDAVIGALKSQPEVVLSVSSGKLGKDAEAAAKPYETEDGQKFDHIFDYLLDGKKTIRGIWTPGITEDMFSRTVMIDYKLLGERCRTLCAKYENAVSVHVTSPNGTDIEVPVKGRKPLEDNGDFSVPGSGGNIPAGEVFISPVVGSGNRTERVDEAVKKGIKDALDHLINKKDSKKAEEEKAENKEQAPQSAEGTEPEEKGCNGKIVFDGSIALSSEDVLIKNPITCQVKDGFVSEITGGEEAKKLLKDITAAEKESFAMEADGRLPAGQGAVYARNARNIGELGIGLNPAATITGNMLEDEKAFRTCHFAIGMNYDGDAPCLIHFDGVVRNPTIVIKYADGTEFTLLDKGELTL